MAERRPSKYHREAQEAMENMGELDRISLEKFLANLGIRELYDTEEPATWFDDAVCQEVDADVFYSDQPGSKERAKRICRICEVRAECLSHAIENNQTYGIWGGTTETSRRRLIRERRDGK